MLGVGPLAHARVIMRKNTMKFILASALRMWSRILFIRSQGVFPLIIVPGRVITTLSDWIFVILMDSVNFTVVTGKLNA